VRREVDEREGRRRGGSGERVGSEKEYYQRMKKDKGVRPTSSHKGRDEACANLGSRFRGSYWSSCSVAFDVAVSMSLSPDIVLNSCRLGFVS